jgi:2-methylaconitate cis-trans-isomerase PrpF
VRGGTSKAVFLVEHHLPRDEGLRKRIILSIFGSPDTKQIDRLGGMDPLTSKCAVIGAISIGVVGRIEGTILWEIT